jgi:hypothetical protein
MKINTSPSLVMEGQVINLTDINGGLALEISINQSTRIVHVNLNGVCVLRSSNTPIFLEVNGKRIELESTV